MLLLSIRRRQTVLTAYEIFENICLKVSFRNDELSWMKIRVKMETWNERNVFLLLQSIWTLSKTKSMTTTKQIFHLWAEHYVEFQPSTAHFRYTKILPII